MVRKALAIAVSLAVQGAAVSAPFVHAHPDDHATPHHHGRLVHTHWADHSHPGGAPHGPTVGTDDEDRAVFLNAFVAVATSVLPVGGIVHAFFELPLPTETAVHRPVDVSHSHDPPFFSSLSSRGPPSCLS